jgi:hypothetical protein
MSYYDWPKIMAGSSNNELAKIIKDSQTEPKDKVSAALNELKNRGIETDNYTQMLERKEDNEPKPDENSPILYSKKLIYTFSILFTVIFGGIMFAINLKAVNKKGGIYPVIIFSVLYSALSIYILGQINAGTPGTFILGAIGALILNNVFWNKYIGKETLYHKKSYKTPLIIALSIFIPLLALIIWGMIYTGQV